jgi:hypothetical protein
VQKFKNMLKFVEAQIIKDAGVLEEPAKALGQVWFSRSGEAYVIAHLSHNSDLVGVALYDTGWVPLHEMDKFTYRPTAGDLLASLQSRTKKSFWWALSKTGTEHEPWECSCYEGLEDKVLEFTAQTPEVACMVALVTTFSKQDIEKNVHLINDLRRDQRFLLGIPRVTHAPLPVVQRQMENTGQI